MGGWARDCLRGGERGGRSSRGRAGGETVAVGGGCEGDGGEAEAGGRRREDGAGEEGAGCVGYVLDGEVVGSFGGDFRACGIGEIGVISSNKTLLGEMPSMTNFTIPKSDFS